jgi:O-antigen/teichoic acid export membrane protein
VFNKIVNTFTVRVFNAVFKVLLAVLISQFLGAEGKGEQGIILATIAVVLVICNFVGGSSLVYIVPRFKTSLIVLPSYLWSILVIGISFLLLYFTNIVDEEFLVHILILSLINSFTQINSSILLGKEKVKQSNYILLSQSFVVLGSVFALYQFGYTNIYLYINSLYIAYLFSFLMSIILIRSSLRGFFSHPFSDYFPVLKKMLTYGFWNQLGHISQILSFRFSYYILEEFSGKAAVGVYSNAVSIMESLWLVSGSITVVQYSRIVNMNDKKAAAILTAKLLRISLIITVVLTLIILLIPTVVYTSVFGSEFADIRLLIYALAPGVLIYPVTMLLGHYFSGNGEYKKNFIAMFVGLLITIISCFILIPEWSHRGAAWAASLSYISTSGIMLYMFFKDSSLKITEIIPKIKDIQEAVVVFQSLIKKKKDE